MIDHKRIANIGSRIKNLELQNSSLRLFHCSFDNHGDKLFVENKPPKDHEKNNESNEPRLCVSRSVPQAFAAMCKGRKTDLFIYGVDQPECAEECVGIADGAITSEFWLPPGESLTKIATVEGDTAKEIVKRTFDLLRSIRNPSTVDSRIVAIVAACEVLQGYFVPEGLAAMLRAEIGLEDSGNGGIDADLIKRQATEPT